MIFGEGLPLARRGRAAPMNHNDLNGNRIHDPPAKAKQITMTMTQEIVHTVPNTTQPLQQIWNKAVCSTARHRVCSVCSSCASI